MNFVLTPESFEVRELFNPQLKPTGHYLYYLLEKKGISHKEATKRIGASAYFCGVKDKNATTKQWFCTSEKIDEVNEPDFKIKFKGCLNERIHIGKHKGNTFSVKVEFTPEEQKSLKHFKAKNELICNYFGEQRFSENTIEICKSLEEKNYEAALKLFLTKNSKFDSDKSRAMKKVIEENWGNWKNILEHEEIKDTGKVVLFEYLEKNPKDFEGAFLYTEEKSTKTLIKAAQALRFNIELNKMAKEKKANNINTQIAGQNLLVSASKAFPRKILIRPTKFEENFRKTSLERKTFFSGEKFRARRLDKTRFELTFELQKGSYATVFLSFLDSWLKNKINKG
ncbi:MAG: tRNA pseudouridine(13) synthase TruD [archaeon]|jgi:tRNA pseudouridine13 synthase